MPPDPVIRPATHADAAAIALLLAAGTLTPDAEDPAAPARYAAAIERIRAARGEVLVCELDGDVVGVCQLVYIDHLQHQGGAVCEIESVHVAERVRSRGIGAMLLDAGVGWARARGCYRVQLTSNLVRVDAHRFYAANGFVASHVGFKRALDTPRVSGGTSDAETG